MTEYSRRRPADQATHRGANGLRDAPERIVPTATCCSTTRLETTQRRLDPARPACPPLNIALESANAWRPPFHPQQALDPKLVPVQPPIHDGIRSRRARSSATTPATPSFSTRAPSTRGSRRRPTRALSTIDSSTRPRTGPPAGSTRTRRAVLDGRTSTPRSCS